MISVTHQEQRLRAQDGTRLFMQRWAPQSDTDLHAELLVVHGYGEHGSRYRELAHFLAETGIATSAIDLRGHGHSEGKRGHIDSFDDYLGDLDCAIRHIKCERFFLLGHSNGGLVVLDYVASHRSRTAGVILSNPFLALAMRVPRIKLWLGQHASELLPTLTLPSGLKAADMSRDPVVVDAYGRDPLNFFTATTRWYTETLTAQLRVRNLRRLEAPIFYAYSDADPVALSDANKELADQLKSPDKTIYLFPDGLHEILNEVGREDLRQKMRCWLAERLDNDDKRNHVADRRH